MGEHLTRKVVGDRVDVAIERLNLSPDMLREAGKTAVYRRLEHLTKEIEWLDNMYDIVTCCGTFTHGHVGPDPALRNDYSGGEERWGYCGDGAE